MLDRFASRSLNGKRRLLWFAFAGSVSAGAAIGLAACSGSGGTEEEMMLATSTNPLQLAYVGTSESQTNTGVNLLTTSSRGRLAGRATGAIRANWTDGAVGECGATFISHQYAVTAAHCIATKLDVPHGSVPLASPFSVSQYDTTRFNVGWLGFQSSVTGEWPDYTRPNQVGPAQGYVETSFTGCTVVRRCSTLYGSILNCPFAGDADIGLIRCPTRGAGSNWVHVAGPDSGTQNIDVWWFHEILDLATGTDTPYTEPYEPDFNYEHYFEFTGMATRNDNYHYHHNQPHQLFPLISKHSATNQQYRGLGIGTTTTSTNSSGCHGTSGSGVFVAGTDSFLGPVSTGGTWANTQLCSNMDNGSTSGLAYTNRAFTATFENLPEIVNDRF